MPNHVRNILQFNGDRNEIDRLFAHIKSGDSVFDFNSLIPMPKTLNIESGSRTAMGLEAVEYLETGSIPGMYSWLLHHHQQEDPSLTLNRYIEILVERGRCDLNLGEVARDNLKDHGSATWYEWCCDNWGTKWNAYSIEADENQISFETAWAAPEPVIDKMAELFPAVRITHSWSDESMGSNCGRVLYQGGEKAQNVILDHTSDAYGVYVFCWGRSDCLEQDADGVWKSKDCETCGGCV